MLSVGDIAAERRGGVVYLPLKKSLKLKGATRKKSVKSVYIKKVCLL